MTKRRAKSGVSGACAKRSMSVLCWFSTAFLSVAASAYIHLHLEEIANKKVLSAGLGSVSEDESKDCCSGCPSRELNELISVRKRSNPIALVLSI
jgi:hypothetical protein